MEELDDTLLKELSLGRDPFEQLFRAASNSSNLRQTLETLTATARTDNGRAELASNNLLPITLYLVQSLLPPPSLSSARQCLALALKLLRNLCAGEGSNQNSFVQRDGVCIVSAVFEKFTVGGVVDDVEDRGILRFGLQVLANVSLAGGEHQRAIWSRLFPDEFVALARVRSQETCDPLCMIVYVCCDGNPSLVEELCGNRGLPVVEAIVRTASVAGFKEDWLKLLLSRICLEDILFPRLFSRLYAGGDRDDCFSAEQAYLLMIISEILSERLHEITVPVDFSSCVLGVFKKSAGVVDSVSRGKSGLPTGCTAIDILGYSLTILRDICALKDSVDVVDALVSSGLLELLLFLLRELEPPAIIRKTMRQSGSKTVEKNESQEVNTSYSSKVCPYKGFRSDIVAVIGNCAYLRKHAQDEIRQRNGILLLLQQCVTDEDNPFLREWGIWCVRNLLEGNVENQQAVAELELQGSVDVPELAGIGLRVEVDEKTRRAKLVNVT